MLPDKIQIKDIDHSRKQYLEELWFTMHHSEDPNEETLAIRCYLDESGTDSNSQNAVVAGLILNKPGFLSFDKYWSDLLFRYEIEPPLHMREFGKDGRLGRFDYKKRNAIFTEVADIINYHKYVSIAAVLNKNQFETFVHEDIRKSMGFYGFCFLLCVQINHQQHEHMNYQDNIAFLLDDGTQHKGHILGARDAILKWQKTRPLHVAGITFDDDTRVSALQAADVIAWAVRKRAEGVPLNKGFEPIAKILDADDHLQSLWEDKWLRELSESLIPYIQQ
jgi:hypothetical protein